MSPQMRLSRCAAGLVLLLAGCSGTDTEPPKVASLRTSAAPSSAPAAAAGQRPVYPVDATDDERRAVSEPWVACLVAKGGPKWKRDADALLLKGVTPADDPEGKDVLEACLAKQPEAYDDHQKRTDPATFKDNQRAWYRCAQDAGYKLTAPDPDTAEFGLTEIGPNGDAGSPKMQECKRKAFAE
ncbi:hypothetical protein [Actinoplanes sp. NPDC089786]|uniref:hypothetical protein n=1 Tax=Actinoplanes sp. NPDC089786 TaxID=3155185 RepID=UPI003429B826